MHKIPILKKIVRKFFFNHNIWVKIKNYINLKKVFFLKIFFYIYFHFSNLNAIEFDGKFIQGHFIIGKTEPKAKIWIDKKRIKVTKNGFFVFGIGRDRKYDVVITKNLHGKKRTIVKRIQKKKVSNSKN